MSERIDAEIKRLLDSGQTPMRINIGSSLCKELQAEQSSESVAEYKGYPVECLDSVEPNYLNIERMTITSAEK